MEKQLVIITGASSGIGLATAKLFQEQGYPLLLLARRLEKFKHLEGKHTLCRKVDLTNRAEFKHAVHEAEQKLGPVGCLVNNAGLMLLGFIQDQDPQEWQKMFEVNVMGLLYGIQIVLPGMIERKKGMIINISSIAGRYTFPAHAAYCGTKYAVHAITETVRKDVAKHNIQMVLISPGAAETELLGHTTSHEIKANYEAWKKEMVKLLDPNDVARAVLYAHSQPANVTVREVMLAATRQEP